MRFREFYTEDEYSAVQSKLGQNPLAQKVNADQWYKTSRSDQLFWKPEDFKLWEGRAANLQKRCDKIYARLLAIMPPEEKAGLNGVKIVVPLTGEMSWGAAHFEDKLIKIDLGSFWDLSDDCLAYVIGHEIGHMVWAFGPNRGWAKTKGKKISAPENRRQEMDADVYGARLALQLGYDRRKAWDHFTIAMQREPFDPKYPEYPSVAQRKANVEKDIAARKQAQAQAKQQPVGVAAEPEPQQQQQQQPVNTSQLKADKNAMISHVMNGLRKFEIALANDPSLTQFA